MEYLSQVAVCQQIWRPLCLRYTKRMMCTLLGFTPKPYNEIPHITSFPIIGSSWLYFPVIGKYKASSLHLANEEKFKKYGTIVREVSFGGHDFIHLFDPKDIEVVFRNEGRTPRRLAMPAMLSYFESRKHRDERSKGLLLLQDQEWMNLRFKVQPNMLRPRSVLSYLPALDNISTDMVHRLSDLRDSNNEIPDFVSEVYKWALESISFVVLDRRLGCLSSDLDLESDPCRMIKAANSLFTEIMPLSLGVPIWRIIGTPSWRRFVNAMDTFHEIAIKYISEAAVKLKTEEKEHEMTFLERLLVSDNLDRRDALAMAIDALIGGIDTTSHAFAFTLYHLAKNVDAQNKAYEEIIQTGLTKNSPITAEVLSNIPYLRACFRESLRLHPVVSGTTRILNKEVILSGYKIPPKVLLILHIGITGRFPEYFDEVEKFKPERWFGETKEPFSRFLALPFSFGVRMCIGARLAEQELFLLLIKGSSSPLDVCNGLLNTVCFIQYWQVLQHFRVEYHHEDVDIESRFVNAPNKPMKFRLIDRK